jgi:hypothetical protein
MATCLGILAGAPRQPLDVSTLSDQQCGVAKISNKSKRFRTKEQIVRDLVKVLNMDLHYGTKFAVVSEVFWVWSEFEGKHKGCRYWSEAARRSVHDMKNLVHEHVVPRKEMLAKFDLDRFPKKTTEEEVRSLLDRYCIGCVVTRGEDVALNLAGLRSRMPTGWDGENPWARYDHIGIKFVCVEDGSRTE